MSNIGPRTTYESDDWDDDYDLYYDDDDDEDEEGGWASVPHGPDGIPYEDPLNPGRIEWIE